MQIFQGKIIEHSTDINRHVSVSNNIRKCGDITKILRYKMYVISKYIYYVSMRYKY